MDTITLKGTDLKVSRICFGTMTFGGQTDEANAGRMVDRCLDEGINFFDTANAYTGGKSEEICGRVLRGRRDRVVLASKVANKVGEGPDLKGLSRAAIMRAIDDSLRRLSTDYLDIYYLHLPDYEVPIDESLQAMDDLVKQGKVRYVASSNYSGWQVVEMLCIAEKRGWGRASITQPMYNLIARGIEQEYLPMCKHFGISTVVYNPLAGGLLTGKQQSQAPLAGSRFDQNKMYLDRYWHDADFAAVEELKQIASKAGRSLVSLALNWIYRHTAADCIILGASRLEHLDENLKVLGDGPLDQATLDGCDQVWLKLRGPTPKYNR
ncbi:MAG: aldo/keto reductase [Acidobacteriota bacterium]|nr:aldo/keto reductase [Acidobacteriota bacterium]